MVLGISGRDSQYKDLLETIIQYHIYCKQKSLKHPDTFKYPVEKFALQAVKPGFCFTFEDTGWEHKSFSNKLKQCASIILDIPLEYFENEDYRWTALPHSWDRYFFRDYKNRKHKLSALDVTNLDTYEREPLTIQQFLDEFGSNACRDVIHDDFWITALFSRYYELDTILYNDKTWTRERKDPYFFNVDGQEFYRRKHEDWLREKEHVYIPHSNWIITDIKYVNEADRIKERGGYILRIQTPFAERDVETPLDDYMPDALIMYDRGILTLIQETKEVLEDLNII